MEIKRQTRPLYQCSNESKENDMSIHESASDMTKDQMLSKISQLSDEIDANEDENRAMQEQINQLYARIDAMPDAATE